MTNSAAYALSFTSGALLAGEAAAVTPVYLQERDWAKTRTRVKMENLLQARVSTSTTERGHLMWAAACRSYLLIAEFAEEVLRERFLTLAGTLAYEDYDSFYRSKAMWHSELNEVTDLSYKKLRQVLFRMMVEAGLLTKRGDIEPVLLSTRVAECLNQRTPSDIRFFPSRVA